MPNNIILVNLPKRIKTKKKRKSPCMTTKKVENFK